MSHCLTTGDGERREKTLIRRASGILTTLAVPFSQPRRHSVSADELITKRRFSAASGWPNYDELDAVRGRRLEIVVQTAQMVYRTSEDGRPSPVVLSHPPASTPSQKPHAYHYKKARPANLAPVLAYTPSHTLRPQSSTFDPLESPDHITFLPASPLASRLSFDTPDSPFSQSSDAALFSPAPSAQSSCTSLGSSVMNRMIETTSSIGHQGSQPSGSRPSHWASGTSDERSGPAGPEEEDYTSWIKFESPLELLSPALSSRSDRPPTPLPCLGLGNLAAGPPDDRFCIPANPLLPRKSHHSLRNKISRSFKGTFSLAKSRT